MLGQLSFQFLSTTQTLQHELYEWSCSLTFSQHRLNVCGPKLYLVSDVWAFLFGPQSYSSYVKLVCICPISPSHAYLFIYLVQIDFVGFILYHICSSNNPLCSQAGTPLGRGIQLMVWLEYHLWKIILPNKIFCKNNKNMIHVYMLCVLLQVQKLKLDVEM